MHRDRIEPRFDADEADDAPETPREGRRQRLGGTPLTGSLLRLACAAAVIAGISVVARETMRAQPPVRAPEAPLGLAFVPTSALPVHPAVPVLENGPRFRLTGTEAADPVRTEPARLSPATGLRETVLSQGEFAAIEAPHLRLTVTEGGGGETGPGLFVTIARRAADGPGLSVTRTGERGRIDTKFGAVETLEATLVGSGSRICTGFTSLEAAPARIDGWLCAPLGQPPEPRALACALDRLMLDGSGDAAIEAVFREADGRRDPGCRPPQRQATAAESAGQTGSISVQRRTPTKK
ncbi:hypothetical protein [Methylobacterium nigriterrae]|uniref:hypothetical protein n=1 Tax=Methylobacterium nigriterrae TaxID=3127512 RepID=UPI0030139B71